MSTDHMRSWSNYPPTKDLSPVVINDKSLPLVSVVTPSYNQGQFISATIDSVLGQNYPNLEYWVVDGGSTDETLDVLRKYGHDERFNWISERDRGQADAVNKGWRRCRGELIGWLNSDDTYLPGALPMLIEPMLRNASLGVVYGDVLRVDQTGEPIERMYARSMDLVELLRSPFLTQPGALQRRTVVERVGPLDVGLTYALDYDFYVRAALAFKTLYVPQLVATYRMHGESKTTTGGSAFAHDIARVVDACLERPDLPGEVRAARRRIRSDLRLQIAMEYMNEGNYAQARSMLTAALRIDPFRPRNASVALLALDQLFHTRMHAVAVAAWKQWNGQRYNKRAAGR